MNYYNSFVEQIKTFWKDSSPSSRIGMIGTAVVCVALLAGVGYWSAQPNYVALADNLSPEDAAQVASSLEKSGIQYKFNFSGSTVMVDKSQWSVARSQVGDIVGTPNLRQEPSGWSMDSPGKEKYSLHLMLQDNLAASIEQIKTIDNANVLINVGKNSMIDTLRTPPTASVVLTMRPNQEASTELANAVATLVANSVDGLQSKNVKVLDDNGVVLSSDQSPFGVGNDSHTKVRTRAEELLQGKAKKILDKFVGFNQHEVMISAQVDLQKVHIQTKEPSANKVAVSEVTESEKTVGRRSSPRGTAGTASNLSGAESGPPSSDDVLSEWEKTITENEIGYTISDETLVKDYVKKISIAAVVDLTKINTPAEGAAAPEKPLTREQVERLLKGAVGFDEARGDSIEVLVSTIPTNPYLDEMVLPPSSNNEFILEIIRNSSLGLGAMFAFVMGFLALRKIRPITIKEPAAQISPERTKHLSDLSLIIKQNPDVFSQVLSSWMDESSPSAERPDRKAA